MPDPERWTLSARDGVLTVTTGVTGRASRFGHRLTIRFDTWRIAVTFDDAAPVAVELRVDVRSLKVLGGEGGLTPLSAPERALATSNALSTMDPDTHPEIVFTASGITRNAAGYTLDGELTINGVTRTRRVEVGVVEDGPRTNFTVRATVRHSEHQIKPYSLMMGSLRVADEVTVELQATVSIQRPDATLRG